MSRPTWMPHVRSHARRRATAVVLAAAIVAAPVIGGNQVAQRVAASSVQTTQTTQTTVASIAQQVAGKSQLASVTAGAAASDSAVAQSAQKRVPVGPIINWIKKTVPWLLDQLIKAVKAGWNAFLKWWNGLAGWIKFTIQQIAGGTVWEIWQSFWDWLF